MKTKSISIVCALTFGLLSVAPAYGAVERDPTAVGIDAVVGRPLCFAATIIGAGIFVATLPFSLTSHSVKSSAKVLVGTPGKATFVRPLGDFDYCEPDSATLHARTRAH